MFESIKAGMQRIDQHFEDNYGNSLTDTVLEGIVQGVLISGGVRIALSMRKADNNPNGYFAPAAATALAIKFPSNSVFLSTQTI